ncbi:hypothetical protein OAD08_00420 [bacterium]|nr:hypothetical protein [bacterium]
MEKDQCVGKTRKLLPMKLKFSWKRLMTVLALTAGSLKAGLTARKLLLAGGL